MPSWEFTAVVLILIGGAIKKCGVAEYAKALAETDSLNRTIYFSSLIIADLFL